jgi:hypothetical protein
MGFFILSSKDFKILIQPVSKGTGPAHLVANGLI